MAYEPHTQTMYKIWIRNMGSPSFGAEKSTIFLCNKSQLFYMHATLTKLIKYNLIRNSKDKYLDLLLRYNKMFHLARFGGKMSTTSCTKKQMYIKLDSKEINATLTIRILRISS